MLRLIKNLLVLSAILKVISSESFQETKLDFFLDSSIVNKNKEDSKVFAQDRSDEIIDLIGGMFGKNVKLN